MRTLVSKWKRASRIKDLDAEKVLAHFQRLLKKGPLTPTAIVASARGRRSPIHKAFTWDDAAAAEAYRLEQAKYLIRSLVVVVVPNEAEPDRTITIRKYHSLGDGIADGKNSQYRDVQEVVGDSELRGQRLRKVWNQLLVLQSEYQDFQELSDVWEAIDSAKAEWSAKQA